MAPYNSAQWIPYWEYDQYDMEPKQNEQVTLVRVRYRMYDMSAVTEIVDKYHGPRESWS